jgi:hypothetical protein
MGIQGEKGLPKLSLIVLVFLVLPGCTPESPAHDPGDPEEGEWWHLTPMPDLVIGGLEADESQALFRVQEGTVLPDGRIVLTQPSEVLLFSREGRFDRYLGRQGEGPGEFLSISSAVYLPDSGHLRIFDDGNLRITTLTTQGDVVATEKLAIPRLGTGSTTGQPDGSFIGVGWRSRMELIQSVTRMTDLGPRTDSMSVVRLTDSGLDTISVRERGVRVTGRIGNTFLTLPPPLGRILLTAVGPGIIAQGFNDEAQFQLFGLAGERLGLVHTLAEKREITPGVRAAAEREFLSRYGKNPLTGESKDAQLEDILKGAPKPEILPAIDEALFDSERNLWLRLFQPEPGEEAVWEIHSDDGAFLARARLPSDLEILEIGRFYVLGLQKDSLDVETVLKFELNRR